MRMAKSTWNFLVRSEEMEMVERVRRESNILNAIIIGRLIGLVISCVEPDL
jgi:hypothetical protein